MAKPTPASPWEYQFDQPLLVAVCQRCHRALSLPRTKSSRRPSASCAIVMGPVKPTPAVPAEFQPDQPALGAVCQRCHRAPSFPMTKTSRRPSAFTVTIGEPLKPPPAVPWEYQLDQPLLTALCQRCHRLPSLPVAKSSRRPSALELMVRLHACLPIVTTSGSEVIPLAMTYNSEAPCSIRCGTVNSVVCTALPVATPM